MKNIFFISCLLFLISCSSDALTERKAKKIINKCLNEAPYEKTTYIKIGEHRVKSVKSELKKYQSFIDEDLLTVKEFEAMRERPHFNPFKKTGKEEMTDLVDIQATSKGEKYLVPSDDKKGAYFKTYEYKLDEVTRVHEMPSFNIAEVNVKFKVKKKTPFAKSDDDDRFINPTHKFTFQKTSNGWEFCEGRKRWWSAF